jgi:hypothetical protein
MMEPSMDFLCRGLLASLLVIGFALSASGQDGQPAAPPLTGKERLGGKWTDEQRIDNCKVPVDKRGTKPRPTTCAHGSTES